MDIIGIGRPCMDIVSVIDRLPTPDHGTQIRECSRQGGGVVPTAIAAAARLGAQTGFIGVSGGCIHGRAIVEDFLYHGVDLSHSIVEPKACSDFAIILSDLETRGRSILYHKGNTRSVQVSDLDKGYIQSAKYLHIAHNSEVEVTAARWIQEAGGKVVYDATKYTPELEAILPSIDVFIASEFFYQEAFKNQDYKTACHALMQKGPAIVVITLGKNGCIGLSHEGFFEEPIFPTPVVDTLGAGDVFHGAYIVGLLQGWSARESARFANAVSAVKVTAIGGRAGIPDFDTVMEFISTGNLDRTQLEERVDYYKEKWLMHR